MDSDQDGVVTLGDFQRWYLRQQAHHGATMPGDQHAAAADDDDEAALRALLFQKFAPSNTKLMEQQRQRKAGPAGVAFG